METALGWVCLMKSKSAMLERPFEPRAKSLLVADSTITPDSLNLFSLRGGDDGMLRGVGPSEKAEVGGVSHRCWAGLMDGAGRWLCWQGTGEESKGGLHTLVAPCRKSSASPKSLGHHSAHSSCATNTGLAEAPESFSLLPRAAAPMPAAQCCYAQSIVPAAAHLVTRIRQASCTVACGGEQGFNAR